MGEFPASDERGRLLSIIFSPAVNPEVRNNNNNIIVKPCSLRLSFNFPKDQFGKSTHPQTHPHPGLIASLVFTKS